MKTKISIGILVIGIILAGIFLLSKPIEKPDEGTGGMPISDAILVFNSDLTVNSKEEALAIFNQNFDRIVENTKEELTKYGKSQEVSVIEEMIFFSDDATVERRAWKNDQYWLLPPNKLTYVLITPAVSQREEWEKRDDGIFVERVRCKEIEGISLPVGVEAYEDVKKYFIENCPKNVTIGEGEEQKIVEAGPEIYWTETELYIKYLVDDEGVIYWAGQYMRTKPWFGY